LRVRPLNSCVPGRYPCVSGRQTRDPREPSFIPTAGVPSVGMNETNRGRVRTEPGHKRIRAYAAGRLIADTTHPVLV